MSTQKDVAEEILNRFRPAHIFSIKPMFGEFALYANQKTVGFICDNTLFIKITPHSEILRTVCETAQAYPGSKPYFVVSDDQFTELRNLSEILIDIAAHIPEKKSKK